MHPFPKYNWHLEVTSRCTLKCPQCLRTVYPESFKPQDLDLEFIKRTFSPEFLRENVLRMTFSGGLGDAIYNKELIEIVKYLKESHPHYQQVINTNGSYKSREWWTELCSHLNEWDEIIFSIDGWDNNSNRVYRANSDWDSIMTGMEVAVQSSALVRWSAILFNFNEKKIGAIKDLAESKGVDSFHYIYSERFTPKTADGSPHPLAPVRYEHRSAIDRTQRHKMKFPQNTPKSRTRQEIYKAIENKFKDYRKQVYSIFKDNYIYPTCLSAYRGSYIDHEGYFYPCSWISHQYPVQRSKYVAGKENSYFEEFGMYREKFNLRKRSLEEIYADPIWEDFQNRWNSKIDTPIVCEQKCLNSSVHIDSMDVKTVDKKEFDNQFRRIQS